MKVVHEGDAPPVAPEKHFTGHADFRERLNEQRLAGMRVANVAFINGAKTLWHRHHGEQVLYVLGGNGWIQKHDENPLSIRRGDVVYVAPRERHWHGAEAGQDLEHLAVTIGETEWEEDVEEAIEGFSVGCGETHAQTWEHTALAVLDLDRAVAFYRDAFGYEVLFEERGMTHQIQRLTGLPSVECDLAQLRSPISRHVLELTAFRCVPRGREHHGPTRPGSGHVSLVVDHLEAAVAAVTRLGGSVLGELTKFDDGRRAYCRDPSGTVCELAELRAGAGRHRG